MSAVTLDNVEDSEFMVFDRICGFWTESGFTTNQGKAKIYRKASLTDYELLLIVRDACIIVLI